MDAKLRESISNFTNEVREYYNVQIPIEDICSIVSDMGGEICEFEDKFDGYDGRIKRTVDNRFVIEIWKYQNRTRKNFTIAHELGHLFLHMGYQSDKELWEKQDREYKREGYSDEEYEANEFAACFLMPKNEYKEKLLENVEENKVDIQVIADYFNVSQPAALNRGRFLGYFE